MENIFFLLYVYVLADTAATNYGFHVLPAQHFIINSGTYMVSLILSKVSININRKKKTITEKQFTEYLNLKHSTALLIDVD